MSIRNSRKKRRRNWLPIVSLIGLAGVVIAAVRSGRLDKLKKHCCERCGQARCCCNKDAASTEDEQAADDLVTTAAD